MKLFKYYLHHFTVSPVFFILNALYVILAGFYFFLTSRFFSLASSDLQDFFSILTSLNILYFPLLTSFVAFKSSDFSLPFSHLKITLAKLFSAFTAYFFTLLLSMIIPLTVNSFVKIDSGAFFCSFVILIFYSLSALAFTLFLSSFFYNASFSFASSSFLLILTNIIHLLPRYTDFNFSSSFLNYFSLVWHFDAASKGIADLSDVLFFIITFTAFIMFTNIVLDFKRESSDKILKHKILSKVFFIILLLILSNIFSLRIDFTTSKKYTFSKITSDTAKNIQQPFSLTYYRSKALLQNYPSLKDTEYLLNQWASLNKNITLQIKNTASKKTQELLQKEGIPSQKINLHNSDSNTFTEVYSALVLDYAGKRKIIPFIIEPSTLEFDLTRNTLSLLSDKENFVMLVSANASNIEVDYSNLISFLEYQGYIPIILHLESSASSSNNILLLKEILKSSSLLKAPLVVLGSSEFSKEETDLLEQSILSGVKVFIASQSFSVNTLDGWEIIEGNEYFNRMLFTFGLYLDKDPVCSNNSFLISLQNNKTSIEKKYPLWPLAEKQKTLPNGIVQFWPSSVSLDNEVAALENFICSPLITLSKESWHLKASKNKYITNPYADFYPDEKYFLPVTAAEVKKINSSTPSLIFYGDQYAFSDQILRLISNEVPDFRSFHFLADSLMALEGKSQLTELKYKFISEGADKILTSKESKKVYSLLILIPFLFNAFIYSAILFLRRKFFYEKA